MMGMKFVPLLKWLRLMYNIIEIPHCDQFFPFILPNVHCSHQKCLMSAFLSSYLLQVKIYTNMYGVVHKLVEFSSDPVP